jgi:alginate O-acetyltransferase complex protein AlgI
VNEPEDSEGRFDFKSKLVICEKRDNFTIGIVFKSIQISIFINSLLFLYLFLPITLFFATVIPPRFKNVFLLTAGFIFYAWGGVSYLGLLVISTILNWCAGLLMNKVSTPNKQKTVLVAGILLNLLPLLLFKYTGFFIDNFNVLGSLFGLRSLMIRTFTLPLGISFYSFKAITYLLSVHRKETPVQRNYIDLALYISFFPSVLSGPIDRYRNFFPQLQNRIFSFEQFSSGIKRFSIGLGKKVLIANSLSVITDDLFSRPVASLSTPLAWLGIICYSLQIYYDFSGYTDMAIGVAKMFGFELTENFNFPYISKSIKEFWKRWHISLSTWLRDYLFLPLAYATSGKLKNERYFTFRVDHIIYMVATSVTFFICGLWHGAAWNFIVWGLIHGFLMIIEQLGFGRLLKRLYTPVRHFYALFFLTISWAFFRTTNLHDAFHFTGVLFGVGAKPVNWLGIMEFMNTGSILTMVVAIFGATRFFSVIVNWAKKNNEGKSFIRRAALVNFYELSSILIVFFILAVSTLFLVAGTNNAFIYFRF